MTDKDVEEVQQHLAAAKIDGGSELTKLQVKQRAAVERAVGRDKDRGGRGKDRSIDAYPSPPNSAGLHPDLQELSFGEIGSSQR
jgi:LAS seventeen-binding protein 5